MKSIVLVAIAFAVSLAVAEKQPISRYQSIINRQMFGPLPPGFDPTKSPNEVQKMSSREEKQLTQEQEKLQSAIHFSVINVTPEGATAVGFTDNSDPKTPKHYYLKVGEERDGWTVKEANAEESTMTIVKGEIEVSLTLGGNSAKGGGTTSRAGGATSAKWSGFSNGNSGLLSGSKSLRARRLQRQQEAAAAAEKQKEEAAAREAERQAQAEQEKQQREAERAEQRQQLLAIQEELKKVREAKAAEAAKSESENEGEGDAHNDAE